MCEKVSGSLEPRGLRQSKGLLDESHKSSSIDDSTGIKKKKSKEGVASSLSGEGWWDGDSRKFYSGAHSSMIFFFFPFFFSRISSGNKASQSAELE